MLIYFILHFLLIIDLNQCHKHKSSKSETSNTIFFETGSFLFDLSSDPFESNDLFQLPEYEQQLHDLLNRTEYWDSFVGVSEEPSHDYKSSWKSCGGVCPWMESNFSDYEITQKYFTTNAPNIVFLLLDSWGFNDVGWQSNYMSWTTPNIDRIANEGMILSNYYTHQTCTPSRGALMTGRYSLRLGLSSGESSELPLDEMTLAQELRSAGYKNYLVGKWHLGMSTTSHSPLSRGFHSFYGYLGDRVDYWTKLSTEGYLDLQNNRDLVSNENEISSSLHLIHLLQEKAESFIADHAASSTSPMFLLYSLPLMSKGSDEEGRQWLAPDSYLEHCEDPGKSKYFNQYNYCALSVMLDEVIGNITCALSAHNLSDNTLLIVSSDNGGDSDITGSNYPLHGGEGDHFRGGMNVNTFLHGKVIPEALRGSTYSGLMHISDWLPTLMHIATDGEWDSPLSGKDSDGLDMWPSITSNSSSPRREIVHMLTTSDVSIQIDSMKLDIGSNAHLQKPSVYFERDESSSSSLACYMPSLVSLYSLDDDYGKWTLYDLSHDPTELTSLSKNSSYSNDVLSLESAMSLWQTKVIQPEVPSSSHKHSTWKACGGICPWLDPDDDDDSSDFSSLQIEQIYSSDSAPNVVFVLVDDWGWNDVGWRSTYLGWTTPNIDRIASEGIKLNNYFTHFSCVPSRGALLTGRFALRLGLWASREDAELPLSEVTLAQELQSAGYRTYLVGKWHMGFSTTSHTPTSRGFDSFYGYYNGYVDYWTKEYSGYLDLHQGLDLVASEDETSASLHNAHLLQSKAEEAIRTHVESFSDQPMFLYYSLQLIHGYWQAPDNYLARCSVSSNSSFDDYISDVEQNYCALNLMLDEVIANLTCVLEETEMADNTLLIVVSDNGGEETVQGNNYPFRGAKGSLGRGGLSATAFVHSPLIPEYRRGSSYDGLMHVTDWFPTIMGLATNNTWKEGLRGQEIDGKDMWAALLSDSPSANSEIVHYADGDLSFSYQRDMLKLTMGISIPSPVSPQMFFEEDLNPSSARFTCSEPSLLSPYSLSRSKRASNPFSQPAGETGINHSPTLPSSSLPVESTRFSSSQEGHMGMVSGVVVLLLLCLVCVRGQIEDQSSSREGEMGERIQKNPLLWGRASRDLEGEITPLLSAFPSYSMSADIAVKSNPSLNLESPEEDESNLDISNQSPVNSQCSSRSSSSFSSVSLNDSPN